MSDTPTKGPSDSTTGASEELDTTTELATEETEAETVSTDDPTQPWYRSTWTLRRWVTVVAAVGVFAIGAIAGAVGQSGTINELEDEKAALVTRNDRLRDKVNDRDAQREADEAAADREEAEERRAERERPEAEQAAAEQAQRDAEAAGAAAAAAEAERNTIPGSGIFAIGPEKAPGRYRTEGPSGANPVGCYYALLRAPTSDSLDNIIDNNIVQGPGFADLVEGQFFETTSCQQWVRVG
jgi:hypothetical protein